MSDLRLDCNNDEGSSSIHVDWNDDFGKSWTERKSNASVFTRLWLSDVSTSQNASPDDSDDSQDISCSNSDTVTEITEIIDLDSIDSQTVSRSYTNTVSSISNTDDLYNSFDGSCLTPSMLDLIQTASMNFAACDAQSAASRATTDNNDVIATLTYSPSFSDSYSPMLTLNVELENSSHTGFDSESNALRSFQSSNDKNTSIASSSTSSRIPQYSSTEDEFGVNATQRCRINNQSNASLRMLPTSKRQSINIIKEFPLNPRSELHLQDESRIKHFVPFDQTLRCYSNVAYENDEPLQFCNDESNSTSIPQMLMAHDESWLKFSSPSPSTARSHEIIEECQFPQRPAQKAVEIEMESESESEYASIVSRTFVGSSMFCCALASANVKIAIAIKLLVIAVVSVVSGSAGVAIGVHIANSANDCAKLIGENFTTTASPSSQWTTVSNISSSTISLTQETQSFTSVEINSTSQHSLSTSSSVRTLSTMDSNLTEATTSLSITTTGSNTKTAANSPGSTVTVTANTTQTQYILTSTPSEPITSNIAVTTETINETISMSTATATTTVVEDAKTSPSEAATSTTAITAVATTTALTGAATAAATAEDTTATITETATSNTITTDGEMTSALNEGATSASTTTAEGTTAAATETAIASTIKFTETNTAAPVSLITTANMISTTSTSKNTTETSSMTSPNTIHCPAGWKTSPTDNGKCYLVVGDNKNWFDAEAYCQSMQNNSYLTSVANAYENFYVNAIVTQSESISGCDSFWIGLHSSFHTAAKVIRNQSFFWTDGQPFHYSNWEEDQTNPPEDGLCVYSTQWNGKWDLEACGIEYCFVCEHYL